MSRATSTTIRAITATSTRTTTPKSPSRPQRGAVTALSALAGWTLFAFGGAYLWTLVPLVAGTIAVALVVRPPILARGARALDATIVACLVVAAVQLVPLPAFLRLRLSPGVAAVDRAVHLDAPPDPALGPPAPLAVDREGGVEWLLVATTVAVYFWSARHAVVRGQARHAVRAITACGGVVAAIGLLQHATAPHSLYWIWRPVSRGAEFPFGPFVNRNDMAAWIVMALPLATGYMLARLDVRRREGRLNVETAFDATGVWVAVAICAMAAVLVVTLSRSGLIAAVAGAAAIVLLAGRRMERHGRAWLLAGIAGIALVGAAYANLGALMTRVGETVENGLGGRREIWGLTWQMIRDFPLTGVGVGSFARAMSVYQPPHLFAFNHAHNEYLQLTVEGGLLMGIPIACAMLIAAATLASCLRSDHTPLFWIRVGAAGALAAIGVQNFWETGLRMPANGVLFALCAALALHPSASQLDEQDRSGRSGRAF